jgi:hypothetical protein
VQIGFLTAVTGRGSDKQNLASAGAVTYALASIREQGRLANAGVQLNLEWRDTTGDQLTSARELTRMICQQDHVAFFGLEHTCSVEATLSSSWNLPLISHVSQNFIQSLFKLIKI